MIGWGFLLFISFATSLVAESLVYEQNVGQAKSETLFLARAGGYSLNLTREGAVFLFPSSTVRLRIRPSAIVPEDGLPGVTHYLVGTPDHWHTGAKTYRTVRYSGIARGVDMVFQGENEQVEWQYVFSPLAASADTIVIFEGTTAVRVEPSGDLRIDAGTDTLKIARPVAYQTFEGGQQFADAHYEVVGPGRVRVHSTWPDHSRPLVIDPALIRTTRIGGSAADIVYSVAADPHGGVFLAGETRSTDIPRVIGQPPSGANTQILLIKLNAAGEVDFTVLAGGTADDAAYAVAVDEMGQVYLTGQTSSSDFPVTQGAQQVVKGGQWDAFYMSLSADGRTIRAATYLGGSDDDKGTAICLDRAGVVYIAGSTQSENFPATSGRRRGLADAFVARLDPKTARCRYIALFGGSLEDKANAMTIDSAGDLWMVGQTSSDDFGVTRDAVQPAKHGLVDAFVARIDASTGRKRYATFLGGGRGPHSSGIDNALSVTVDPKGGVWVAGETDSENFPVTADALERSNPGHRKAFVVRLDQKATRMGYASYLGGSGESSASTIVADGPAWVLVSGTSQSTDFPPEASLVSGRNGGAGSIFAVVLDRDRGTAVCAARVGENAEDRAGGVAIMGDGAIAIAGWTPSSVVPGASRGHVFTAILRCSEK
jgi:hypothetical protein